MITTKKNKVFVVNPTGSIHFNYSVKSLFMKRKFLLVNHLHNADLCVFTGGEDINPKLYGEKSIVPHEKYNDKRDEYEIGIYKNCQKMKIPTVGICRGAQLLHVLNGNALWQDVDNHGFTHDMIISETGQVMPCTSTHHQMMRIREGNEDSGELLAYAQLTEHRKMNHNYGNVVYKIDRNKYKNSPYYKDPEVIYYSKTNTLCFQPHPEYTSERTAESTNYFFRLVTEKLFNNTDNNISTDT